MLYGGSGGLKTTGDQMWTLNSSGINGVAEFQDFFGAALAAGDFNHDGRDDLAIGIVGKKVNGSTEAGAVSVIYGSKNGLSSSGDQLFRQSIGGLIGSSESLKSFGATLAAGDFNGDGYSDLAMAAPNARANGVFRAGEVVVIYGSAQKLTTAQQQLFTSQTLGLTPHDDYNFGVAMTTGDFNHDGRDELVIDITGYDLPGAQNCGLVAIVKNGSFGLTSVNPAFYTQNSSGIAESAEDGAYFGYRLATGDYNGDGRDDLVAASLENLSGLDNPGCVHVLYGSTFAPTAIGSQFFAQGINHINGSLAAGDEFGGGLA